MDKSGADAFVFAKANGVLGKSFTNKKARLLFEAKSLSELWTLLFRTQPPLVPEVLLSQEIEEKAFSDFINNYIKFISAYDNPEPVLINQLLLFEGENLKEIGADAEKLEKYLHEKQDLNVYYVGLQLYSDPEGNSLIGIYPFSANTFSIMPYEPLKPFYLEQEVDKWMIYLYVSDSIYGYIPFDDFSNHVRDLGRYDETHYFCEVDEYQARGLIADLAVEM